MRTMLEPWAYFTQPIPIVARFKAQLLFNRRVDEDARHFLVFGGKLNQLADFRFPQRGHYALAVSAD